MNKPDKVCIWENNYDDGTISRGWTVSYPSGHDNEYVRHDIYAGLLSENDKLRAHIRAMQAYVQEYLEPGPYVSKHGKVETFNEPHQHQSEGYAFYMRTQMQSAILNDLIHMLDGPEEREVMK